MWNYHDKWKNHEENCFLDDYKNVLNEFTSTVNGLVCGCGKEAMSLKNLLLYVVNLVEQKEYGFHSFELLHDVYLMGGNTFIHSLNTALISHEIASWLGYSRENVELATLCGLLHDVGKMQIAEEILEKPGMLTKEEREIIKQHSVKGFTLLLNSELDVDEHVKKTALQHHERYDGSGYPYGLVGEGIDVFARIVAIADVYDAMTSDRVYRQSVAPDLVLEEMQTNFDKYDPEIFTVFVERAKAILL